MRITRLILERYKRLMLSDIQRLDYRPTETLQLIIGSNGSGKSSVLEELSPLPSHHSNFTKGGMKEIYLTHQGVDYVLSSDYSRGTGHHSFLYGGVDGDELNPGGTITVQTELVEKHFQLTRELWELLVGIERFTEMSTAKRREWLTRLSSVDLSLAFRAYRRARELHRDHLGAVRHTAETLNKLQQETPSGSTVTQQQTEIDQTVQHLNRLFELRGAEPKDTYATPQEFDTALQQAMSSGRRVLSQKRPSLPEGAVASRETVVAQIQALQADVRTEQALLDRLLADHTELLNALPSQDESLSSEEIAATQAERTRLASQLESLSFPESPFPLVSLPLAQNPTGLLESVYQELMAIILELPDNPNRHYSRENLERAKQALAACVQELQTTQAGHFATLEKLSRIKECETFQCPNCQHAFKPGVDPQEAKRLERQAPKLHQRIQVLERQEQELREEIDTQETYYELIRRFRRLVQGSEAFQPLWDALLEGNALFSTPSRHRLLLSYWEHAQRVQLQRDQLQAQIELLDHRLRYVQAADTSATQLQRKRQQQLEAEVAEKTQQINHLNQAIQGWQRLLNRKDSEVELLAQAGDLMESTLARADRSIVAFFQQAVQRETQQAQVRLATLQEDITQHKLREQVVADTTRRHGEVTELHALYGLLVKALAPTDGLIGRYLMGLMHNVVELINAVIAEIWTYPMEVLPSRVEREELDYRFPLNVNNGAVIAPDIARGSSSQRDIVNFAFRLLVMRFLELEEYPLFLDEFGSTFDEQHRLNLIPFINKMVELGQIQQVFYISHYAMLHGAFTQAQVCVLDPTNITVPKEYNQHVEIS